MKADGHPLKPTGLKDWLRARGLFIECLCPLALDVTPLDPYSCRLVQNKNSGDVMAFCHFESDNRGCGMRGTFFFDWVFSSMIYLPYWTVNITAILERTELFSFYAHFPTISM